MKINRWGRVLLWDQFCLTLSVALLVSCYSFGFIIIANNNVMPNFKFCLVWSLHANMYLYGYKKETLHLVKHPHAITRNSLLFYLIVLLIVFSAAILEDINPVVSLRATLHLGTIHDNAIKTLVWWVELSIFNFSGSRLMGSRKMISFDFYHQSDQGPIHSLPTYNNAWVNAFPYCCYSRCCLIGSLWAMEKVIPIAQ